jgi:two-component system cell cycle response regulator DivK
MARILIVDDRSSSREVERIMLESFGHEVVEADSGREALAVALETVPDLVLLDLHMPEVDGFGTLAEFRRQPQLTGIPIVALTASAMKGDDVRVLEAGFSGYITKPIFLRDFRNQIRSFLDSSKASEQPEAFAGFVLGDFTQPM